MAEPSYKGKIGNSGAQKVKAPYPQTSTAKPKTQKGGDLRVKKGGK